VNCLDALVKGFSLCGSWTQGEDPAAVVPFASSPARGDPAWLRWNRSEKSSRRPAEQVAKPLVRISPVVRSVPADCFSAPSTARSRRNTPPGAVLYHERHGLNESI
ncbi:unnamed protein product, partial [Ectocarpus sp. 12 AP-2014]